MRFGPKSCGSGNGLNLGSGYFVGGRELRLVQSHRDLGVTVDQTLKFHIHINIIVGKASGLANQLLRGTVCRSREFMVTLFVSHIRPILEYCSTVWNLGYLGDARKLEGVQRRWSREVVGMEGLNYLERLKELRLFSICGRMLRTDLIKVWKIFHADVDVGLDSIFERNSHSATRGHSFKLSVPRCRSELRRRYFNVRCVQVWNNLPEVAVSLDSVASFKRYLDGHLGHLFFQLVEGA